MNDTEGFYISDVQKQSGADISGIKKGDIIKSINGIKISKFSDLKGFLNTKSPNDVVEVSFIRDEKLKTLNVKLEKLTTIYIPILGTLRELNSTELKKLGSDYGLELQDLSDYYKEEWISDGVNKGSLIISINDLKVNSIADVKKALANNSDRVNRISILKNNGEKMVYRFR